jgi:hypothetical protein
MPERSARKIGQGQRAVIMTEKSKEDKKGGSKWRPLMKGGLINVVLIRHPFCFHSLIKKIHLRLG